MGTIREAIEAQVKPGQTGIPWYLKVAPVVPLGVAKVLGYGWYSPVAKVALALGLLVLVIAAAVLMIRRARHITCPVCGAPFGFYAFAMQAGPQQGKVDSCPNCGVKLDERMPDAAEPNEAYGLTRRVRLLRGTDEL